MSTCGGSQPAVRSRTAAVTVMLGRAKEPGDGQADHHRQGEPEADPAGEVVDLAPTGAGGIAEHDMGAAQRVAAAPVQMAKVR